MTKKWMKILAKISEKPISHQEPAAPPNFQAHDIVKRSPFSFLSLKVFHLLELYRRLKLLEIELETITAFMENVVEKYRKGTISREKASYLASWASIQKKILLSVKKSVLTLINEALSHLDAQDRYFLIFELKDALKRLQIIPTISSNVKKKIKAYDEITRSAAWKETVNNLPFEELIMSKQSSVVMTPSEMPHRFNGLLTSSSHGKFREMKSLVPSLMGLGPEHEKAVEGEETEPWDEKIAEELMSSFMVAAQESTTEDFEVDSLDEEIEKLDLSPEIVSKDLEREIKSIMDEIRQKKQLASRVSSSTPKSSDVTALESDTSLNHELDTSSSIGGVDRPEEEVIDEEDFFPGMSAIMGSISEDEIAIDREHILQELEEIKRTRLGQKIQLKFPHGFRARGEITGFLWVNGSFHAVVQLERVPKESILLYILSQNASLERGASLDGSKIEDSVRELISRQLEVSKRDAFDEDILWQYSMEKYLGLLPWEVKSSKQVIFPLSLLESTKKSVALVELKEENDTYQWIMQHGELKSITGGFLGYLLGVLAIREADEKKPRETVHVLKARNDVREVLRSLRGGIAVSETYMDQFYQRISRMWSVSLEEAKLPQYQARYLLYFFYSGSRKDIRSCERWLMNRFDMTYQRVLGIRSDSQSPRALVVLS